MTLESQYKEFLKLNPRADLSFEEWKKVNARLIKQAIINIKKGQKQHLIDMIKNDEELGLYNETTKCYCGHTTYCDCGPEEPKQNWYHDGKIIDGKQETLYNEEEVIDIAKQAFVLGKDFGLIGTFKEWFNTVKKKS
jgi:hypothetical protein